MFPLVLLLSCFIVALHSCKIFANMNTRGRSAVIWPEKTPALVMRNECMSLIIMPADFPGSKMEKSCLGPM